MLDKELLEIVYSSTNTYWGELLSYSRQELDQIIANIERQKDEDYTKANGS